MCLLCSAVSSASKFWPRPPLGLDAVLNSTSPPAPTRQGQPRGQDIPRAERGQDDQGAYAFQTYNTGRNTWMTPSLAREMTTSWSTAAWRVGGPNYPQDFGFGPGFHGDCMSPQFYMRPGIKVPVQQGGRQI